MSAANSIDPRAAAGAVAVVALRGELDAYDAPAVRKELQEALESGRHVVLDLRATGFMDSVVGGEILEARKAAKQLGLRFALVLSESRSNHVRRMLEQTNLIEIFDVYDTPEAAAAAFAN
jgi:anti-anti-sigma factor